MQKSNLEKYRTNTSAVMLELMRGFSQLKRDIDSSAQSERKVEATLLRFEDEFEMKDKKDSMLTQEQLRCRTSTQKHGHCIQCLDELYDEVNLIEDALSEAIQKYITAVELAERHAESACLAAAEL